LRERTGTVFKELDIEGRTVLRCLCGCGRPRGTPRRLHGPWSERAAGEIETAEPAYKGGLGAKKGVDLDGKQVTGPRNIAYIRALGGR
jgi:hypothetical protein